MSSSPSARQDAPAPWDTLADGVSQDVQELFGLMRQVGIASVQLVQTATEKQIAEAKQVLIETRRAIYRILADGDGTDDASERSAADGGGVALARRRLRRRRSPCAA